MNIVVIGAGAVGGYFGGKLANAGIPVTFLVREKRYSQLKERGLRIESIHGNFTVQPQLVLSAEEVENPDLVILSVKNYHLEEVNKEISTFIDRGAKVLPLLNGVRHLDKLISTFGTEHILGGICYIESTLNEHGDIIQTSPLQDIVFGPLDTMDEAFLKEVETLFLQSGVKVKLSFEIITEMWSKYIFLATLSGITAATRSSIGVAQMDPVTSSFLEDYVNELVTVAKANEKKVPEDLLDRVMTRIKNVNLSMTSSMHRDLEKGLPIELESIQGAILEMAEKHNIKTPCTRAIYALLHPFIKGDQGR
ncbi:MAG: ketopantoate reductase family protein [Desulfitobacterium hafniense]|nr:ketopantoate reductase family protein [Desulfitobacterium hafniense]